MAVYSQYMLYIGYGRHIPIGLPDTIAIMGKGRGMSILPEESTVQILLSNLISRKLCVFNINFKCILEPKIQVLQL